MSGKFGVLNPFKKWKKGDFPCSPTVTIVLNEVLHLKDGSIGLSASLAADAEIDWVIDQLIKDLEAVRRDAKRTLKNQLEKIRSS